ncbi:MAG: SMC-Scp complex subunit ScpB [Deltaproteobacteria bacterium]|nr:SMC-Scp complex subunit ScpB [Deltaproteobacteria bacterium]
MDKNGKALIEALLFASSKPVPVDVLQDVTGLPDRTVREALLALAGEYDAQGRGIALKEVAGGFQIRTKPEFSRQISAMYQSRPRRRLSRLSLEALAIVAYRQPVTRSEIENIRGVDSGAVMKTLLVQGMIRILGRKESPGRPMLYGTTREFLEYFELRDIESLPSLEEIADLGEIGSPERES